jgi:NodT family efflux transporter outer membrane factor (OMF) lipoprotein
MPSAGGSEFCVGARMVGPQPVPSVIASVVEVHPSRAGAERAHDHGRRGRGGAASLCAALVSLAMICAGVAGCTVGPDYVPPEPPTPQTFVAAPAANTGGRTVDPARWWRALHDRELNSLVERAVAASPTLEIALDRVQQARAQEAAIFGAALPIAEGSAGGGWGTGSDLARGRASPPLVAAENAAGVTQVVNIVGFDAAWEVDVFGKFRRAIEAAQYNADAAVAARNLVLISVIADVTRAYLDLRALQMQLEVVHKNIEVARQYLDFVQERFTRGITNELDVTLAQRELARLQSQVAPLIGQINATRYVIAVLIGEFPERLGKELARPGTLPALPGRIQPGLPIDLLRRRPDIVEAERQLASATALIGVATADLFPAVVVTAGVGHQQGVGGIPINPIWSVGPAIAAPLLDFGRLDALVELADFRARELLANYKQTVLAAVRDVDTAAAAYAAQQDRLRHLEEARTAAKRAVSLAQQRFDRGVTDSLNVIDAQRQEYILEQEYVAAQASAAEQFVALYRSLGGGWEDYQALPPLPPPLPAIAAAFKRLWAPEPAP